MVPQIEELCMEIELGPLGDHDVLDQREVCVDEVRPGNRRPRGIAQFAWGSLHKSARIEPVTACHMETSRCIATGIRCNRACPVWIANDVGPVQT